MPEILEKPKAETKKATHRWAFTCVDGGAVNTVPHEEAARQLVHYQVARDEADALDLLESHARPGQYIPIPKLGHGRPGRCSYVSPHERPVQHADPVRQKG